jgi:hypothetical protein
MKTSDIEQIIKDNPNTVFYRSTSYKEYFTIEGFTFEQRTRYSAPTKVAITRGIFISIDDATNEGTICIAPVTTTRTLNQIESSRYANAEEMRKATVKARILDQATREQRAKNHASLASLHDNYRTAFANHNIETTYGTITNNSYALTLTLTLEQAQALLNIIEG